MLLGKTNLTKPKDHAGVKHVGKNVCLSQPSPTEQFKGNSLDELRDFLIARGEQRIEETADRIVSQLREGTLLSEETVFQITQEVIDTVVSKVLPTELESQRSLMRSVERLARTPSKALGF